MYASITSSMAPPSDPEKTPNCPYCGSEFIDRRSRHGLIDCLKYLIGRYPFRCRRCHKDFYLRQRRTEA